MITRFFLFFVHVASVRHLPTAFSELILCQNLDPSYLPSKEAYSNWSLGVLNYTIRERICCTTGHKRIEGLNWKDAIFCIHPHQNILKIQREGLIMQPHKEVTHFLQLLVIQLSKKTYDSNYHHPKHQPPKHP